VLHDVSHMELRISKYCTPLSIASGSRANHSSGWGHISQTRTEHVLMKCSLRQGSILGPKNYPMDTKPLSDVIRTHGLRRLFYADDTPLCLAFKTKDEWRCTVWCFNPYRELSQRHPVLDAPQHAEVYDIQHRRHNSKSMNTISINVGDSLISSTSCVRNLGVMFDSSMTMEQQVNAGCTPGNGQLRKIGCIRRYLSNEATNQ